MTVINTRTGKIIVTDKELLKKAKKWVESYTFEEFSKMLKDEIEREEANRELSNRQLESEE